MEHVVSKPTAARPRFLVALRGWIEGIRARRLRSRELKQIAQLPDYLLRDIGRDDLITNRVNLSEHIL